ncbi:hypothetical protein [Ferrimonas marina]|uniref:Uncharacterized protein n=1 Tax=Ferrimonas marina TaxID=299255 RepID=A0A1M5N749_9GAMM|nr:hypothetical protein [Ferrimonas marina]SHG85297.1 hypothetical protein SAMN02745129_0917 [Ferrimonas marina]
MHNRISDTQVLIQLAHDIGFDQPELAEAAIRLGQFARKELAVYSITADGQGHSRDRDTEALIQLACTQGFDEPEVMEAANRLAAALANSL